MNLFVLICYMERNHLNFGYFNRLYRLIEVSDKRHIFYFDTYLINGKYNYGLHITVTFKKQILIYINDMKQYTFIRYKTRNQLFEEQR